MCSTLFLCCGKSIYRKNEQKEEKKQNHRTWKKTIVKNDNWINFIDFQAKERSRISQRKTQPQWERNFSMKLWQSNIVHCNNYSVTMALKLVCYFSLWSLTESNMQNKTFSKKKVSFFEKNGTNAFEWLVYKMKKRNMKRLIPIPTPF